MKYFVFVLILTYFTLSAATANEDQALGNFIESKLIRILNLQGILGDLELNATYKNIKTLNIGNKSTDPSRQPPDFGVNNQVAQPVFHGNNQMHADKAPRAEDTATAIKQLKAQIENLQTSVRNLQYLLSSNENKATSCSADNSWESVQLINVPGVAAFRVLCAACGAGPGWIVIQRRLDGSVDFYRDWNAYRFGFGYYDSEFFMGLEYLHRLTISRPHELYIEFVDFENRLYFARYDNFLIGSVEEKFMLKSLGTYSGNAGDALRYNLHDTFSTYDSDNDGWLRGNCANYFQSGWWFASDANSNLNGRYFRSGERNVRGIWWYTLRGYDSLKSVKMLIRPKYTLI